MVRPNGHRRVFGLAEVHILAERVLTCSQAVNLLHPEYGQESDGDGQGKSMGWVPGKINDWLVVNMMVIG